jgi:hypothetical protein
MIEETPVDRWGISPSVTLTDNISSRRPGAPTREHLPALLLASSSLISIQIHIKINQNLMEINHLIVC